MAKDSIPVRTSASQQISPSSFENVSQKLRCGRRPMRTSSSTVMSPGGSALCGRKAILCATSRSGLLQISVPRNSTVPLRGFKRRARAFRSVDLPEPFGPMMAEISARRMETSTEWMISVLPYATESPRARSSSSILSPPSHALLKQVEKKRCAQKGHEYTHRNLYRCESDACCSICAGHERRTPDR